MYLLNFILQLCFGYCINMFRVGSIELVTLGLGLISLTWVFWLLKNPGVTLLLVLRFIYISNIFVRYNLHNPKHSWLLAFYFSSYIL